MKECSNCRRCYDDALDVCPEDNNPLQSTISMSTIINDRYLLEKRLGKGGMGVVFKAKHTFLKTAHAIKIILPDLVNDEDDSLLVRFRQEAVLSASIDHPNVIRVTDFGVENNTMPYLVMEFIDGLPLSDYLKKHGKFEPNRSIGFFRPIALAVAEAHKQGIVHRDLKPQNIMIQNGLPLKNAVKVLDFGLAKIKSPDSFGSLVQAKTLTLIGSPAYMSPEQWENGEVDNRTDIYSLGVLLFQLLTGKVPFDGDTVPQIMFQHMTAEPPSFESLDLKIPPEIERIVRKALAKESKSRYQSVEEMISDLDSFILGNENQSSIEDISNVETNLDLTVSQVAIPKPADMVSQPVGETRQFQNKDTIGNVPGGKSTVEDYSIEIPAQSREKISVPLSQANSQETIINPQTGNSPAEKKRGFFSPLILLGGAGLLFILLIAGGSLVYFVVQNYKPQEVTQNNQNTNQNTNNTGSVTKSNSNNSGTNPERTAKERVLIEGGKFKMGRDDVQPTDPIWGIQYPSHTVTVESFLIDKTEVTNKEYLEFTKATGYTPPSNWEDGGKPPAGKENHPVTFVSLADAQAYARWKSGEEKLPCRLPTEAEWEFAARNNVAQTTYPWGNEWNPEAANLGSGKTVEVGSLKDKTLDNEVSDLLGNVIEWTSSPESLYPGHPSKLNTTSETLYIIRGSSWGETQNNLQKSDWLLTKRQFVQEEQKSPYLGFRLVCDQ
jgi:serine/threonine protein kinase